MAKEAFNELEFQEHVATPSADTAPLEVKDGLSSPARRLQAYLENHWDDREAAGYQDDRWSIRRMIGFVFLTCTAFWAAVIFLGQALF